MPIAAKRILMFLIAVLALPSGLLAADSAPEPSVTSVLATGPEEIVGASDANDEHPLGKDLGVMHTDQGIVSPGNIAPEPPQPCTSGCCVNNSRFFADLEVTYLFRSRPEKNRGIKVLGVDTTDSLLNSINGSRPGCSSRPAPM